MAINTLPVEFRRNYAAAPFIGMVFIDDLTAFNDWLTNPTRYAGQISAVVDTVGDTVTVYKLSADRTTWEELGSGSGGTGAILANDIDVLGVDIGSYEDGDNIPAGTELEAVLNGILTKVIPPTYDAPSLTLSGSGSKNVETGTTLNLVMTPTFTQNDGGAENDYNLEKDSVNIYNDTASAPYSVAAFDIPDGATTFQAFVDYDNGPVKNDNQGNPDPTGQILAGTATSNVVTYNGRRKTFYGIDGDPVNIRSNPNDFLGASNGTLISFTGSGDTVVFAYPDTLQDLSSVELVSSGFTFDITSKMTRVTDQSVNDASGGNAITYKVYEYSPASSFTNATFNILI